MHYGSSFMDEDALSQISFGAIGDHCKIKENASLYFPENMYLGNYVRIDDNVIIVASSSSDPVVIGDYVHIASGCYIVGKGGVHLQEHSTLGPNVCLFSASDDYTMSFVGGAVSPLPSKTECSKVLVGPKAIIGASSILMPGSQLSEGSSLGALSMLKVKTGKKEIFAGIPAEKIGNRE